MQKQRRQGFAFGNAKNVVKQFQRYLLITHLLRANVVKRGQVMSECMDFPQTFEKFAEQYKMTDTEKIYSNGTDYIPVFRVMQWLQHTDALSKKTVIKCKNCCVDACDGYGSDEVKEKCEFYTVMTNADRIRSYSDEQLARLLHALTPQKSESGILKWLQEETKVLY